MTAAASVLDHLIREPEEAYHAARAHHLSSHALADFRRCPHLFRRKELGTMPAEDTTAYRFGRAAHCRILEGVEVFLRRYAVGGPTNPRTGRPFGADTKAFGTWAAEQGRPVVAVEDASVIEQMAEAVTDHPVARPLLATGVAEGVVRAVYAATPCQIRLDWLHPTDGIVDLKTIDRLEWFEHEARIYGYVHQLAFYRAVLGIVSGQLLPAHLIAAEKQEPFRVGVWRISDQILDVAARENVAAMARLALCRAADRWPTGYEQTRAIDHLD